MITISRTLIFILTIEIVFFTTTLLMIKIVVKIIRHMGSQIDLEIVEGAELPSLLKFD